MAKLDAQFHTHIQPRRIENVIDLPVDLDLDEASAERLEADLHAALIQVLTPYVGN